MTKKPITSLDNSNENSQADLYMSEENPDDASLMFPQKFDDDNY